MFSNVWESMPIFVVILLVLFLLWMMFGRAQSGQTPEEAINQTFLGTKYQKYIPNIIALSRIESGNWTNTLTREANNIFSMSKPYKRNYVAVGTFQRPNIDDNQLFLKYSSYKQASEDFYLYMQYVNFSTGYDTCEEFNKAIAFNHKYALNPQTYYQALNSLCS